MEWSSVYNDILEGKSTLVNFIGWKYISYGIIPYRWYLYKELATLVKSITLSHDPKSANFAKGQESVKKDVGRAFEILQSRFRIIK